MSTPQYPRSPLPRLQFRGKFFCDPSTVNNNVNRYNVETFRPNYNYLADQVGGTLLMNGSWNPEGSGVFTFEDCYVTNVKTISLPTTRPSFIPGRPPENVEPLLKTKIRNTTKTVQAKMSDLDPQMQYVSEIYGLKINAGTTKSSFSGEVEPCAVRDMWMQFSDYPDAVQNAGAIYQSVIVLNEFKSGNSPVLKEFAPYVEASKCEKYPHGALSIQFRLSAYQGNYPEEDFRYGENVGFIEPWLPGSPEMFNAGRIMRAQGPNVKDAPFCLQKKSDGSYSLRVELLNCLGRNKDKTFKDLGQLFLGILPGGDKPTMAYETICEIPYASPNWEIETGGIFEIDVPDNLVSKIESNAIGIVAIDMFRGESYLMTETSSGIYCHADLFVYRLNPNETKFIEFYVTRFGKRAQNTKVLVGYDSTSMDNNGEGPGNPPPGIPTSALAINGKAGDETDGTEFQFEFYTDRNGYVKVPITGGDPKTPRKFIDGQVYGLRYSADGALPKPIPSNNPSDNINILVFDKFEPPARPSWISDVYPIFKQYANLYPSMRTIVSLDDFGNVVARREAIIRAFRAPFKDPKHMPSSRDLSHAKRAMFLQWLEEINMDEKSEEFGMPLYMDVTRKEDLENALQTVIELEHGTIPPYLAALYSIKRGYNQYIADAIRDVSMEEMLHFALACNIMNAVGFRPQICKPGFIPKYPGPLPGGLRAGLVVRIRRCCKEQLVAFMEIEAPEQQRLPDNGDVSAASSDLQRNLYTIAFLYDKVAESLRYLEKTGQIVFPANGGDPQNLKNQVTGPWPGKLREVKTLEDALDMIEIIKEQGEGASPSDPSEGVIDPDTGLPMLSHYFRFSEIVKGRRIVQEKDGFSYTGAKIEINEDGIYNMQDDPNVVNLPRGSRAREQLDSFSKQYKALLVGLHRVFNGEPDKLGQTMSAMYQMTLFAKPLMEMPNVNKDGTPTDDGTTVGVSFQYPFEEEAVVDTSNLV